MKNATRLGVFFGVAAVILHLLWSLFVASGYAQWWVDWILGLHFVSMPITITAFNAVTMLELLVVVGIVGFVAGYAIALIWDWSRKLK